MKKRYPFFQKNWLCSVLASIISVFFSLTLQAQTAPAKLWDKTFGSIDYEKLSCLRQTADGGYILGGYIAPNGDEFEYWVVKLDTSGTKTWGKILHTGDDDVLFCLEQTSDGGYILGGSSIAGISGAKNQTACIGGGFEYWIVKLDANGTKIWDKSFGGCNNQNLHFLQQTSDGGYILGGWSDSGISGNKTQACQGLWDYWVVKLDGSGNKLWDKTFGGSGSDDLLSLQQTSDGGYILGGWSDSGISGDKTQACLGLMDYWVIKLDGSGNKLWDKTFGGFGDDRLYSLKQTSDGGYILGGYSNSGISGDKTQPSQGSNDFWVVKLDNNGSKLWDKTLGGNGGDEMHSLQQTTDGGYILGGYSNSGISGNKTQASQGGSDFWVVKLDASGNKLWDKTFGGSGSDDLRSLQQTSDGGYILGGWSDSPISGDKTQACQGSYDYWVVKLAAQAPYLPVDVTVSAIVNTNCCLNSQETITITVNNFGTTPQSNIPVSYKINNGTPVNEIVAGPLAPNTSVSYAFTTKANFGAIGAYSIEAKINLPGDSLPTNDTFTKVVTTIAVPATPTVTASSSTLCNGSSVILSASSTTTGVSYQWFLNGIPISGATSATCSANNAGSYTAMAIVAGSCSSPASLAVTINAPPPIPAINVLTGSVSFCSGDSIAITAISYVPGATFTWFKNGSVIAGVTASTYMAKTAGSYTVKVTDTAIGCTSAASAAITIIENFPPAVPTVLTGGPVNLCSGDSVTLTASSNTIGVTYQWFKNGTLIPGATVATYTTNASGNYTVTVTAGNCSSTSAVTTITSNLMLATPIITQAGFVLTSSSHSGNQWYKDSVAIPGATAQTYTATSNGTYTVKVTDFGCQSAASNAIVISTTGVGADLNEVNVKVYPNPSDGLFSITLPEGSSYELTVTDLTGKVIRQLTTKDKNTLLNIRNAAKGLYILKIVGEGKTAMRKMVVE